MPRERTFIMIKPDGVQRGLVSKIIARFEEKGFKLVGTAPCRCLRALSGVSCARVARAAFDTRHPRQVALKLKQADKALLEEHYGDLKSKPFFPGLVEYMLSGPVVPMVTSHPSESERARALLSAVRPQNFALCSRGQCTTDAVRRAAAGHEIGRRGIGAWCLIILGMVLPGLLMATRAPTDRSRRAFWAQPGFLRVCASAVTSSTLASTC